MNKNGGNCVWKHENWTLRTDKVGIFNILYVISKRKTIQTDFLIVIFIPRSSVLGDYNAA